MTIIVTVNTYFCYICTFNFRFTLHIDIYSLGFTIKHSYTVFAHVNKAKRITCGYVKLSVVLEECSCEYIKTIAKRLKNLSKTCVVMIPGFLHCKETTVKCQAGVTCKGPIRYQNKCQLVSEYIIF